MLLLQCLCSIHTSGVLRAKVGYTEKKKLNCLSDRSLPGVERRRAVMWFTVEILSPIVASSSSYFGHV